jgi:hypothetical protein
MGTWVMITAIWYKSMSITPRTSGRLASGRFKHGSNLSGNLCRSRVTSQWKSTATLRVVDFGCVGMRACHGGEIPVRADLGGAVGGFRRLRFKG